jgi:predicted lipid-binding transport protein (Tim44 family)
MTMNTTNSAAAARPGTLFGVPVGELGWFASLLMGTAVGFAAFFGSTFIGIVSLLIYNTTGHHTVDYSFAYMRFGMPIGVLVLCVSYAFLATMWTKRLLRKA